MISIKLKIARESLGKNKKEMAQAIGVALSSWRGYEQDDNIPGGKVFASLAQLGFNTNWFFTDDENTPMLIKDTTTQQPQSRSKKKKEEEVIGNTHTTLGTEGRISESQVNMDFEALTFIYKELEKLRAEANFTEEEEVDIAFWSYSFILKKNRKAAQAVCTLFNKWRKKTSEQNNT